MHLRVVMAEKALCADVMGMKSPERGSDVFLAA